MSQPTTTIRATGYLYHCQRCGRDLPASAFGICDVLCLLCRRAVDRRRPQAEARWWERGGGR